MTRKPSCLISCNHSAPEGGCGALIGRHGEMKPAGRVRGCSDMGCYLEPAVNTVEWTIVARRKRSARPEAQRCAEKCPVRLLVPLSMSASTSSGHVPALALV